MADTEPGGEHEHHHHDHRRPESLASVIRNFRRTGLPWQEVLAIAWSNARRKFTGLRGCCGRPGQPGC